jgi:hypothetical protein
MRLWPALLMNSPEILHVVISLLRTRSIANVLAAVPEKFLFYK